MRRSNSNFGGQAHHHGGLYSQMGQGHDQGLDEYAHEQMGAVTIQGLPQAQRGGSKLKQLELQRRLFELGQGQLHGKGGLPGVGGAPKSTQSKLVPSQSLGILRADSRSTKLLIPANQPFRVKIPSKQQVLQGQVPELAGKTGGAKAHAPGDGARMFRDDDEVQHLPTEGVSDTIPDQERHTERFEARRRSSKLALNQFQQSVQGPQLSS